MAVRTSVFCVIDAGLYVTDAGVKFVRLGFAQSAILIFDVDTLPVFESRIEVILEYGVFGEADEVFCLVGCASKSLSAFGFPKFLIFLRGCSVFSPVAGKSIPEGD